MGGRRQMALPYRRYSVPEAVMRKYWVSRERTKVDREAQTEWKPCVVWAATGTNARSSSEPSLGAGGSVGVGRPISAPSTPTWTSSSQPPDTTSSSGGPMTSRSPRPGPSVQVLCIHHDVLKADVIVQVPSSSSSGTPAYVDAAVSADFSEESTHEIAVQTSSLAPSSPEENSKYCQASFGSTPLSTPYLDTPRTEKSDFSCQTGRSFKCTTTFKQLHSLKKNLSDPLRKPIIHKISDFNSHYKSLSFDDSLLPSLSRDKQSIGTQAKLPPIKKNPQSSCSHTNYKDFPGTEMVIPRYSAFPRTSSMVVNTSSHDNSSDSDLSLTDSLEDPSERLCQWPANKLDERLVRGEVTQVRRHERNLIRSKNTFAYFLFLSGEEDSIKEYKLPDNVKIRLKKKEEEVKKVFNLKYKKSPKINSSKRIKIYKGKRDLRIPRETVQCQVYTVHQCVSPKSCPNEPRRLVNSPEENPNQPCQSCGAERRREESTQTSKEEEENVAKEEEKKSQEEAKQLEQAKKKEDEKKATEVIKVVSHSRDKLLTSTISKGESNSKISLTLTVPSKPQTKDDLSIDEKVAKVLLESLEEIRESKVVMEKEEEVTTLNQKDKQEYLQVPGGYEEEFTPVDEPFYEPISLPVPNLKQTAQRIQEETFTKELYGMKRSPHPKHYTSPQHSPTPGRGQRYEDERFPHMAFGREIEAATSKFIKSEQELRADGLFQTSEFGESSKKTETEDEELLRAILKKSMQGQHSAADKSKDSHSEVCELGMKFLANEIDIDQFLAGIPLERIEQDVKRLMYKHFLGSDRTPREKATNDSLTNKKVVVSFIEADERKDKCQCKTQIGQSIPVVCTLCHPLKQDSAVQVSDKDQNKIEKCVSPLDSSVATAVQTLDSFLDTARLPVINENTETKTITISSTQQHDDNCKLLEINTDSRYVEMKYNCTCKSNNSENVRVYHENVEMPNNQSQNYISPRPMKVSIKNNLRGKGDGEMCISSVSQTDRPDIKKHSCVETPRKAPQEPMRRPHPSKRTDSKNIFNHDVRSEKAVEKRSKLNVNRRSMLGGSKFTQMFEVIPEERLSPTEAEFQSRSLRRRTQSLGRDEYGSRVLKDTSYSLRKNVGTMADFTERHKEDKFKSSSQKSHGERYENTKTRIDKDEDGKKPVVVGRFRPDETEKKNRKDKHNDDVLGLSKGWIDFYLLRDNEDIGQIASRDKGEQSRDSERIRRRLPDLQQKGYKGYKSESSECSLPDMRSSGSSSPSSPDGLLPPRHVENLPDVHEFKSKKRNRTFTESDRHDQRGNNMVHSEHSMSSVHSTTGLSEDTPRGEDSKSSKTKKDNAKTSQGSANNACWTVTVAGSGGDKNQPPPDVEMRLCFARDKDGHLVAAKKEARYPQADSYADAESNEGNQLCPRSNSRQYHSSMDHNIKKDRAVNSRGVNSRIYHENPDYKQFRHRKDWVDEDWVSSEGTSERSLHVTGSAITPEEKPRVPTQSERDLIRSHRYRFTR